MIEQKRATNIRNFFSSLAFVVLSVLGGMMVGVAVGAIGTFIYLVIVFPIIIGFLGGYIITENAKYTKARNASLIIITSVLTSFILFGTIFFTRYVGLQVITAKEVFGGYSDENLKSAKVLVEYSLEKDTGYPGFVGYILFKANRGVSIGRISRTDALNLGSIFTWLYWLVELGVIVFITIFMSRDISKKRFCEFCNSWYPGQRHVGGIPAAREFEILNLIKLNDYTGVGHALEENTAVPSTEFYVQSCTSCEKNTSFLSVAKARRDHGKLTFTDVLNATLTPRENKLLMEEIKFL